MAANRFATMLHRNTNKLTMILIYAVLEWILILLLLLNSLFSYLIIKFAQYFGLKPPCLWCSRVDHIFENGNDKNMHRDLLCEAHAEEISKLGYCSNHQKLAASQDMCEDCLSSRPEFRENSKSFTFFGMIQSGEENGHVSLNCSCCGVTLDMNLSPHIVIKPSWDVLEYTKKGEFIAEDDNLGKSLDFATDLYKIDRKDEILMVSDENGDFRVNDEVEKVDVVIEEEKEEIVMKDQAIQVSVVEDANFLEILPQHLDFFIDCSDYRLVPVELIDSATEEEQRRDIPKIEDQGNNNGHFSSSNIESHDQAKTDERDSSSDIEGLEEAETEVSIDEICRGVEEVAEHSGDMIEELQFGGFKSMEIEEDENSLVFYAKECSDREVIISQDSEDVQELEAIEEEEKPSKIYQVSDDIAQIQVNETEAEVSIGTEIPDLDATDEIQSQDPTQEDSSINEVNDHGATRVEEYAVELNTLTVKVNEHFNNRSSVCSEVNEIEKEEEEEEDKFPDTPSSVDSFHNLQKKLLLLEKKDSGAEDSLDGSVTSELEGSDGVVTSERLKSALKAERKALHVLYVELEEERNASAIAANQTMAMINRLQEEKAAMQMEALQYQRMMEEQAEYDQEALQLLNELMVKREREKEELEKELEFYRKKVFDLESKEKLKMLRKSGFSSPSCSDAEDSDEASIDLNQEAKDEDGVYSYRESVNENTPINAVLNLEESIADFEEERVSILEQLKFLEEKLMTIDDEHHEENGNGHSDGHENGHSDGYTNGFQKERNGIQHPLKKSMVLKRKSLLPLFEATNDENGDIIVNGNGNGSGFDSNGVHYKNLAIEEELELVYERLQALEADREFLKHCITSLNKGDKGMHLLHEILQHLKDLRNVDLRVKNLSDGIVI